MLLDIKTGLKEVNPQKGCEEKPIGGLSRYYLFSCILMQSAEMRTTLEQNERRWTDPVSYILR